MCPLRCGLGNSVVSQSISSIASSGSRPKGRGFFAAAFQSLLISPRFSIARNSAAVRLTIFPDFLLMGSPHCNRANVLAAPSPDDGVEGSFNLHRGFPPLLVVARRRLLDRRAPVEKQIGRRQIERAIFDDLRPLVLVPFEL